MKNKTETVSTANLNTAVVQKINAIMSITRTSVAEASRIVTLYPKRLQMRNQTGATIYFNILSNADEEAEYDADPTNFELISIANNSAMYFADIYPLPTPYKILIKGTAASHASDLTIEMINYQPRG